ITKPLLVKVGALCIKKEGAHFDTPSYLFRKSLRSRVSNERKITQINIFFARRDGWSRPLPLGVPRPMSFLVKYHNFVFLKY
ncbi:hypothetical protein, partial [Phocaeicola vulgatus]